MTDQDRRDDIITRLRDAYERRKDAEHVKGFLKMAQASEEIRGLIRELRSIAQHTGDTL